MSSKNSHLGQDSFIERSVKSTNQILYDVGLVDCIDYKNGIVRYYFAFD